MLTLNELADWLEENIPDLKNRLTIGCIDAKKEKCAGLYSKAVAGKQRICLGGAQQTKYHLFKAALLLHWGKSAVTAQETAQAIYSVLYGVTQQQMGSSRVISIDPGAAPQPAGKDDTGIFEYIIELDILWERMM